MNILLKKNTSFCLVIYLILLTATVFAQEAPAIKFIKTDHAYTEWYKESQKSIPNYYKVKKLFDDFFNEHPYEKSPQKSLLFRWFQVNKNYLDSLGNVVIVSPPAEETERLMRLNLPQNKSARKVTDNTSPYPAWNDMTGSWRIIGPYHNKVKGCSGYPMSGGFNDRVYINPYNTQNLFSGQSYGGLWVSQNQGATWKLTDAAFPNGKNTYANRDIYYGDIKASKTNANLIFAATEAGLLKSTDSGDNWALVNDLNYISRPSERAYYVAPSNHDGNMLLATYGRKVFRTTDGGNTWTTVFDNSSGGANFGQGQHSTIGVYQRKYNIAGLAFHPTADNIVYLAVRNASNEVVIHHSQDYGVTWTVLVNTQNTRTLKMEVVPSAPDHIYFFELYTDLGTTQTRNGIFKYDASGTLLQAIKYPVIGHLLDDCIVSPTDTTVMYLGGYASGEVHKSVNGGLTFTTNNPGYSNTNCTKYVHPDVRCFSVIGDLVLIASDGGNSISTDGMANVRMTGQWISGVDLWGFGSSFKGDVIGSGDDHGPTEMRWSDSEGGWEHDGGADSKDITINPVQPRWVYAMDIYRKYRMVTKEAAYDKSYTIPNTSISSLRYLAVNPNLYAVSYPVKDAYLMVSKDNMATIAETLYTFSANITRVKQALRNPSVFYVLVNLKDIYKSTDGGRTFTKITPNTTVTGGKTNITDIEVSNDGSVVWLSYGQVQTTCKVVKSTDGGASWVNYTASGLPSPVASNITMQRGTNGGIYLTTDGGGVWYRDNTMASWSLLGTGLPMLGYVTSTYVIPNKKALRMGTARGAFEHELAFSTSADALIAVDKNTATTCRDTLFFRDFSAYEGTSNIQYAWTFEGGTPAISTDENPKVTYANTGVYDVSLTVTDGFGNTSTHTLNDFITITPGFCTPDIVRGKAIQITAQNSYMRAPNANLTNSNTYTLMAWVKGTGTQVSYAGILSAKTSVGSAGSDPFVHLNVRDANADSAQIGYHHPNGEWWYNSGLYLKPNTWTHIALVVRPTSISIVKDGVRATHTGRNVAATNFTENFTVGTMDGADWYRTFIGEIDEVAVYKRALTDDEIRNTMHLTKNNPQYPTQTDPDLISYYQFNEDAGTPLYDRIGSKDGAFAGSNISRVTSTGPFSGGVSETLPAVTLGENKVFSTAGITLKFPASGTYPTGTVTAYRLDEKPYLTQPDTILNKYWIVRNWGTAKRFSGLESITFAGATLNPAFLSNAANYHFQARPQNSHTSNWFVNTVKANAVQGAPINEIRFPGSDVTLFGQYILSEKEEPCVSIPTSPVVTVSAEVVCTGTEVTVSTSCPAGTTVVWNTGVNGNSFKVSFANVTRQSYSARCVTSTGCQSLTSASKEVLWKAFDLTFINIGQSHSATKAANDRNLWTTQFITPDAGPVLEKSTEANPTIFHTENVNKTATRFWTIHTETCAFGTDGSVTYDMLATPEVGVVRSYNTHENNAPYLMYANREGFTELYAQNHPAYGFFADNGNGGNTYDEGFLKGLYKLSVRYWDQKGQGSIYPSTRQPAGNVLAYQEYWFRIQSQNGVGTEATRMATDLDPAGMTKTFAEVAPNPVSNVIHLKINEAKGQKVNVNLLDASGRTLLQRAFTPETNQHQEEFEVRNLSNGMYFLKVNTVDKQTTLKVVKIQ